MKKIISISLGILIAAVVILQSTSLQGPKDNTFTIGYIAPLTGDTAVLGEAIQRIVGIAQEKINTDGGINGMLFAVDFQDGLCTGAGASNAIQKIIHIDKRDFVFATCSGEALAVLPVTEQAGSLLIGPIATSPDLTDASDLFVRTYQSDAEQGRLFAEYVNVQNQQVVAVLQEQTDYAQGIVKVFSENYQGALVKEEFAVGTDDFRTQLAKLENSESDILLIASSPGESLVKTLTQLQQTNWRPKIILEESNGNTLDILAEFSDVLNGGVTVETVLEDNTVLTELRQEYKNRYNEEIPFEALIVSIYDALMLLDEGIETVGEDPVAFAQWYKKLDGWNKGASGPITINEKGDRVAVSTLVRVMDGELVGIE